MRWLGHSGLIHCVSPLGGADYNVRMVGDDAEALSEPAHWSA